MASPNPQEQQREPQVAVAPLNTVDARDVNRGAQEFDQWLRKVSDGVVTLDRIRTVAGSLPVVGNIIALVDSLGDIVTLSQAKERQLLDWVSLGINLIGVLPAPPTMAAARMSLRPTLFLVRQELKLNGKSLLGDALVNVLVAHLNASIVGEIDKFAKEAQGKLNGILKDAGEWGEKAIVDIAGGLEALAKGKLNASGDAKAAAEQMRAAGDQLLHDPKASISNFLGALWGPIKPPARPPPTLPPRPCSTSANANWCSAIPRRCATSRRNSSARSPAWATRKWPTASAICSLPWSPPWRGGARELPARAPTSSPRPRARERKRARKA
ncbi:hypothetical protein GPU89_13410 [Burkholderia cepacia]|nr:hypothetical protein [Burkholderia cepacia]